MFSILAFYRQKNFKSHIPQQEHMQRCLITRTHARTHARTYTAQAQINKNRERHVPDKSSDLFLFWGSLGFFTGGLRFGGFSTLLGLSLSVPEFSEDEKTTING